MAGFRNNLYLNSQIMEYTFYVDKGYLLLFIILINVLGIKRKKKTYLTTPIFRITYFLSIHLSTIK